MISALLTLLFAYSVTVEPVEFVEVNDLPAPATAPMDELVRYEQLAGIMAGLALETAESEEEEQWYESAVTAYYAPANDTLSSDYGVTADEFQWRGVVEDENHFYTWYSERVLPGGGLSELNSNGRHSEDGFVKDGDGFIAVASCDYEKGTVIDTPFGAAKVYDTGYLAPGQIDVYTSF